LDLKVDECFNFPGKWMINNSFYLLHDPQALKTTNLTHVGRIYL